MRVPLVRGINYELLSSMWAVPRDSSMTERIWVPEDLDEIYSDEVYQAFSDDQKEGLVAFDRVLDRQEKT